MANEKFPCTMLLRGLKLKPSKMVATQNLFYQMSPNFSRYLYKISGLFSTNLKWAAHTEIITTKVIM